MARAEVYRRALRLIETTEDETARHYAQRALAAIERGEVEEALEDLNQAARMAA